MRRSYSITSLGLRAWDGALSRPVQPTKPSPRMWARCRNTLAMLSPQKASYPKAVCGILDRVPCLWDEWM
jgi:hypothetical protein